WRWCTPVVTSPLSCIPTDDMGRVASIAIDLGLCCRFYSDSNCSQVYRGWGILGAWYPGNSDVGDYFKATVGSFQCLNSTSTCPPVQASQQSSINGALSTGLHSLT
ncbi:hypothetical protein K469DRAFT_611114, partial [Zopfia rhizophila CBS 207.26]